MHPKETALNLVESAYEVPAAADPASPALPIVEARTHYLQAAANIPPGHKPYAAIYGLIPADESDEEFAAAVEALR
ncbi:MAG: hypothetical protein Q8O52_14805 [Sulfuritalea sp.]|nr:hypothetical protein [Sulfuritalea sp.]